MPRKLNCWEFKNCGREKGGLMVDILGECPVATAWSYDGANEGLAGGRVCWRIRSSGNRLAGKIRNGSPCHTCEFYRRVMHEEEATAKFAFATTTA